MTAAMFVRRAVVVWAITCVMPSFGGKTQKERTQEVSKLRFEFVNMTAEGGTVKLGPTSRLSEPEEEKMQLAVALEVEDTLEHGARFHNLTLPLPEVLERSQLHTVATLSKDAYFSQLKLSKGERSVGHVNASVALTGVPNDVDDLSMEVAFYKDVTLPLRLFFKVSSKDAPEVEQLQKLLHERGFKGQEYGPMDTDEGEPAVLLISLRGKLVLQKLPAAQQEVEINGVLHHFRASHLPDSVYEAATSSYVIAMEHEGAAKKGPAKEHPGKQAQDAAGDSEQGDAPAADGGAETAEASHASEGSDGEAEKTQKNKKEHAQKHKAAEEEEPSEDSPQDSGESEGKARPLHSGTHKPQTEDGDADQQVDTEGEQADMKGDQAAEDQAQAEGKGAKGQKGHKGGEDKQQDGEQLQDKSADDAGSEEAGQANGKKKHHAASDAATEQSTEVAEQTGVDDSETHEEEESDSGDNHTEGKADKAEDEQAKADGAEAGRADPTGEEGASSQQTEDPTEHQSSSRHGSHHEMRHHTGHPPAEQAGSDTKAQSENTTEQDNSQPVDAGAAPTAEGQDTAAPGNAASQEKGDSTPAGDASAAAADESTAGASEEQSDAASQETGSTQDAGEASLLATDTQSAGSSKSSSSSSITVYAVAALAVVAVAAFGVVRWRRRQQLAGYESVKYEDWKEGEEQA